MATPYPITTISGCAASTKTAIQKYKELPGFAKYFLANRPQRVAMYEQLGYVYCDQINDWYIQVDGQIYLGKELTETEFNDPYRYLGDKKLTNDARALENAGAVSPGPYEIRFDAQLNAYFYFNELGQRVYVSSQAALSWGTHPIHDGSVIPKVAENPAEFDQPTAGEMRDPFEVILDILGNPIVAKAPVAGLYETKEYLDSIKTKRDQYRSINQGNQVLQLYQKRVQDILLQQSKLVVVINEVAKTSSALGAITPIFSVALNFLAPGSGKIASSSLQAVSNLAESKKDNIKIRNLTEDFLYLEKERAAIESKIQSSDVGEGQSSNLPIILISIGVLVVGYLILRKRWLR